MTLLQLYMDARLASIPSPAKASVAGQRETELSRGLLRILDLALWAASREAFCLVARLGVELARCNGRDFEPGWANSRVDTASALVQIRGAG